MNALADVRFLQHSQPEQVTTRFDAEYGVIWGFMDPKPRPTFNMQLLTELRGYIDSIIEPGGTAWHNGVQHKINYAVVASKVSGVFNLGGDLSLFREAIARSDRELLVGYGRKCVDNLYPWSRNCDLPLTTIALVQGEALGGGFECALSASVLVAEESSRMGFPEILFNLFPGMGAYSFLERKVGKRAAEDLISSGRVYGADDMLALGVVDLVVDKGRGESEVGNFIKSRSRSRNGMAGIAAARAGRTTRAPDTCCSTPLLARTRQSINQSACSTAATRIVQTARKRGTSVTYTAD